MAVMDTSYLEQQVSTIIGKLHELFDEIGVAGHERDTRESELFSALSETLHNQLRLVANEKHDLAEEASRLIATIKQMEASLEGPKDASHPAHGTSYHSQSSISESEDSELRVTYPLVRCLQLLKEKHNTISKLHRERFEQVRKLADALESYSAHVEPSFVKLELPPSSTDAAAATSFDLSPAYVSALDAEFTRVYDEYNRRREHVRQLAEEIIMLWAELGTPQPQTDDAVVEYGREAPEQLGLHQDDIARLKARRDRLVEEKKGREKKLKELRATVEELWDRLSIDDGDRRAFLNANRGCGLRTINEFEAELARLNELKRQNLHLFVEEARFRLQELWDGLYFSEEEMLDFTPAFSDVYSDALLSAHEHEISRLESLREQRAPTLAMIDRHRTLIRERDDLAASSQDASRLMARGQKGERRDPGKLLREEKMRKRIAKELPKVEADLRATLEKWEDEYGRPFLVHGARFLDELAAAAGGSGKAGGMPPRSKTPSALNPPARPGTAMAKAVGSKPVGGSVRAPPRSKTPSAPPSTTFSKSTSAATAAVGAQARTTRASPSKIPSPSKTTAASSRVPLSHMPHGNNSPERRAGQTTVAYATGTMKLKMGPPAPVTRAPPPKMKDLFVPPTPMTHADVHDSASHLERSASIVRNVAPEDPYGDDPRFANRPASRVESAYSTASNSSNGANYAGSYHRHNPSAPPSLTGSSAYLSHPDARAQMQMHHDFARSGAGPAAQSRDTCSTRPDSRIMSGTSSVLSERSGYTNPTTVSGSENWEAYESASELGDCASDTLAGHDATAAAAQEQYYQAKLRAARAYGNNAQPQQQQYPPASLAGATAGMKRSVAAHSSPRMGKRTRGEAVMEVRGEDGRVELVSVRDSEQSWDDETAYA